ncbi:hypothetical protein KL86APRO_30187 [uncultured Alphaproteobacteria bacterium]|uniref:Phage-Barnase-EndoU-ColicinE5/D-RelE-like nuclease domain-containing protein n=1 Tax=uncultured Alphaproteobacteria bacterium TaxID=91750 RepID=A0A212KLT5_9PROT|nr:hypothetical protein KL86APRO_30187 [uncultured Alphaproteobacteria bacterium]
MPFLDLENNMIGGTPGSAGPTSGIGANFGAAFDDQARNNSQFAAEATLEEVYGENQSRVSAMTGEALSAYTLPVYLAAARRVTGGAEPKREDVTPVFWSQWEDFQKREAQLAELKLAHPEVMTFADVLTEARKRAGDTETQADDLYERAGVGGKVAAFVGRMAGSFTWRDPMNLGTLGLGGFGRNFGLRVATEAGANSTVEAINQFYGVEEGRKLLGLRDANPWESIAAAGAGAAVLRGAAEGVGPAFRAAEARISPARARARVVADTINQGVDSPEFARAIATGRFSDADVLARLDGMPQTPTVRAARSAVEDDLDLRGSNPYGDGHEAAVLHERKLENAIRALNGDDLRSSTAIGRVIDMAGGARITVDDFDAMRGAEIERAARLEAPDAFRALDEADAKVRDLDARIAELSDAIREPSVGEAVSMVDPETGGRIRAIEDELEQPISAPRRKALEAELETVIANAPIAAAERVVNDTRIGPTKQIQFLENSRRAARRAYRSARRNVEAAMQRSAGRIEAQARLGGRLARQQMRDVAIAAETSGLRGMSIPQSLYPVREVMETMRRLVDEFDGKASDIARSIVERNARAPEGGGGAPVSQQHGPFGPMFTEYRHDAAGAIKRLSEEKNGEAIGALHHPDVGDIDLVWGQEGTGKSDGYGLAKIVRWHPEVLNDLQGILSGMKVRSRSTNRVRLESQDYEGAVRLAWDGQDKRWLLTAYQKDDVKGGGAPTTNMSAKFQADASPPDHPSDTIVDRIIENFHKSEIARTAGETVGNTGMDIGLDELVDGDLRIPIGVIGDDGRMVPQVMTVREILADMAEDQKLAEAMRVCSL